ncbi:MAG TPA: cation:proton antiporter [Opitutus sp.]|nr:cation:proton antiporter [Opitutus sp.]
MHALLVFSLALLVGVLISEVANRSVVSTTVLFLVAGFVAGPGVLGCVHLNVASPVTEQLAEFALVAVLFTDGMKLGWSELRSVWRLPGRALFFGLPLTMVVTAVLAHHLAGIGWLDAWLVGAVLSPTDPVFAAAIVGRPGVPRRLRQLLNVESGVNDGLALPIVLGLLAAAGATPKAMPHPVIELVGGALVGIATPSIALAMARARFLAVASSHEPFFPFAIGLLTFSLASLLAVNEFIAAFAAGVTLATLRPPEKAEFNLFGEQVAEMLKLAALLVFGLVISPRFLAEIPVGGYVFAIGTLLFARPLGLGLALVRSQLDRRTKLTALWFGPKGFASVIYGLMVLRSGIDGADRMFHLIALVVIGSILAHSSTDVAVARWVRHSAAPAPGGQSGAKSARARTARSAETP